MKAMILAAGRGERMRPLTDSIPKPLLKIGEHTLIENHLFALKQIGVREVVINISHHAQQFVQALGYGERYGIKITYSLEENRALGTGGGIYKALPLLGEKPFLVISGDIFTDFPFAKLLNISFENIDAHLIMVKNQEFHPVGDFCLENDSLLSLKNPKLTYASIAVIHPHLFATEQAGEYPLAPLLVNAIGKSKVSGELYQGIWYNIGTPEQLTQLRHFYESAKNTRRAQA